MRLLILKYFLFFGVLIVFIYATSPDKKVSFDLVKSKSHVNWECDHHSGRIQFENGKMVYVNNEPISGKFTINMKSIEDTDIENKLIKGTLENTLRSDVFFDVESHPKAYFETNDIIPLENDNYAIKGDFILFDAGICYDFNGTIQLKNDSLFFKAKNIILDRTDWAIYYGSRNNPNPLEEEDGIVVSDTIKIGVDITLLKHK